MAQPVSRLPLTEQVGSCGICGGQSGSVQGFSQNSACHFPDNSATVPYPHLATDTTAPQQLVAFLVNDQRDAQIIFHVFISIYNSLHVSSTSCSSSGETNCINTVSGIARAERNGTRAETRFLLSPKRTSPFKSVGASVQSTAGSRGVRISLSNAG